MSSKRLLLTLTFGGIFLPLRLMGQAAPPPAAPATELDSAQGAAELPDDPDDAAPSSRTVHAVKGDVRPPVLIHAVDPKYTKSARKQRLSGVVTVALTVDQTGLPQDIQVSKGLGNELDDIALQAVRQYRFKPAMKAGLPVPVKLYVAVRFDI